MRAQAPFEIRSCASVSNSGSERIFSKSETCLPCATSRSTGVAANASALSSAFLRVVSIASSTGVVQDDLPTSCGFVEQQAEYAGRFSAPFLRSVEMKSPDHRGVG